MNTYAKLAITAVIVVAVGAAGLALLGPGSSGLGGRPGPNPSSTPPATPSPAATGAGATPTSPLIGTWETAPSTCGQQNAALTTAGFTADQLRLGGWDAATCNGMTHGSVHTVQFEPNGQLVQRADGKPGWDGTYEIVNNTTIRAQGGAATIMYAYGLDGDRLAIDMTQLDLTGQSEADLWADRIAQTVIYESLPFTRQSTAAATPEPTFDVGTPSPLQGRAATFPVPFDYTLPTGAGLVASGEGDATWWQFRHPGPDGGPTYDYGVIVRAISGGRQDPCQESSSPKSIADPQAFIDYLKAIPTVTVSQVASVTIDSRPAMEAVLTFGPATAACPDVWLYAEDGSITQASLRQPMRLAFLNIEGTRVVILRYENPAWNATEQAFVDSIRFDAPRPSPSAP